MPTLSVRVLLNPKAGAGASLRKLPELRAALREHGHEHDVVETTCAGDASRLVEEARREGVELLAVVGGDGTLNEVVQAYIDASGNPVAGPELAVIPAGTGGDFRRSLGVGNLLSEAVACLGRPARKVDLGRLRLTDANGQSVTRAFINITSFGVGGLTDQLVNQGPKWLGGKPAFLVGSLRATLAYRNQPVRVSVDGNIVHEGPIFNVALANGRFFGGSMEVAPHASLDDGQLDVVIFGDMSLPQKLALTQSIYAGQHLDRPAVSSARGGVIVAEPMHRWSNVLIDMDGETPGRLPLQADVLPGALSVRY